MQLSTCGHMAFALMALIGNLAVASGLSNKHLYSFSEMNSENIKASGVVEWYGKWSANAKANEPDFTKYGEISYFGRQFLDDADYHCGLGYTGCNRWPKAGDIIQLHKNDMNLARKVHFVVKMQNNVNLFFKLMEYAALAARVSAADMVSLVITTFTEQENGNSQVTCEMIKNALQALSQQVVDVALTMIGSPELIGLDITTILPWFKDNHWMKFATNQAISVYNSDFSGIVHDKATEGLCDRFGGTYKAHNEEHAIQLRLLFDSVISGFREAISHISESLNQGTFDDENAGSASHLSRIMFGTTWINEKTIRIALQNPMRMESHFKKQYMRYLISTASRGSGCFIKCNTQEDAQDVCHDTYHDIDKSRFCPRPDKVCQVQCWARWNHGQELELHGLANLPNDPFNIDLKAELLINYENFKKYGNRVHTETFLSSPVEARTPFTLPVCDSDAGYVYIGNFHMHGFHPKRMYPISCGNWRSSGTREFYRYASMGPESSRFKDGSLDHFREKIIPKTIDLSIILPLDAYLAYCELGVSFPDMQPGGNDEENVSTHYNKHCHDINRNTMNMDPVAANVEFCTGGQLGPLLGEAGRIKKDLMFLTGSRHKCDKFILDDLRYLDPGRYEEALHKWHLFKYDHKDLSGF